MTTTAPSTQRSFECVRAVDVGLIIIWSPWSIQDLLASVRWGIRAILRYLDNIVFATRESTVLPRRV
jgi:hypothetical protein